jgi:hypothetical protein
MAKLGSKTTLDQSYRETASAHNANINRAKDITRELKIEYYLEPSTIVGRVVKRSNQRTLMNLNQCHTPGA